MIFTDYSRVLFAAVILFLAPIPPQAEAPAIEPLASADDDFSLYHWDAAFSPTARFFAASNESRHDTLLYNFKDQSLKKISNALRLGWSFQQDTLWLLTQEKEIWQWDRDDLQQAGLATKGYQRLREKYRQHHVSNEFIIFIARDSKNSFAVLRLTDGNITEFILSDLDEAYEDQIISKIRLAHNLDTKEARVLVQYEAPSDSQERPVLHLLAFDLKKTLILTAKSYNIFGSFLSDIRGDQVYKIDWNKGHLCPFSVKSTGETTPLLPFCDKDYLTAFINSNGRPIAGKSPGHVFDEFFIEFPQQMLQPRKFKNMFGGLTSKNKGGFLQLMDSTGHCNSVSSLFAGVLKSSVFLGLVFNWSAI